MTSEPISPAQRHALLQEQYAARRERRAARAAASAGATPARAAAPASVPTFEGRRGFAAFGTDLVQWREMAPGVWKVSGAGRVATVSGDADLSAEQAFAALALAPVPSAPRRRGTTARSEFEAADPDAGSDVATAAADEGAAPA